MSVPEAAPSRALGSVEASWSAALAPFVSQTSLAEAEEQRRPGESLLDWGHRIGIADPDLTKAAAEVLQVGCVDTLRDLRPCPAFVERFPISFARQHAV